MSDYQFDGLPLSPVDPGTALLVTGSGRAPSRLAEDLVLAGNAHDEGMAFVSTTTSARSRVAQCRGTVPDLDASRLGVVDATGTAAVETDSEALTLSVSSTGDLTGISIRFSQLYSGLYGRGVERIRTALDSVSVLSLYTDHRTLTRFVHSIVGRVSTTDGLGLLVLDPGMHDPTVVTTLARLCDGRVDLRRGEDGYEVEVTGLDGQPGGWQPVRL